MPAAASLTLSSESYLYPAQIPKAKGVACTYIYSTEHTQNRMQDSGNVIISIILLSLLLFHQDCVGIYVINPLFCVGTKQLQTVKSCLDTFSKTIAIHPRI